MLQANFILLFLKNRGFSPEDLGPNEHEDVLDDFIEAGDEEVGPKGQAQRPEKGRLLCFLGGFYNQDFRLFHSLALFALTVQDPLGGIQCFLLCPVERMGGNTVCFK